MPKYNGVMTKNSIDKSKFKSQNTYDGGAYESTTLRENEKQDLLNDIYFDSLENQEEEDDYFNQ